MMELFEASLPANVKRFRSTMIVLGIVLLLSIAGIILSKLYWDEYTYKVSTLTGQIKTRGWPVVLSGWSWGFAVTIPFTMGMFFFLTDRKKPSLAVSADGLFINQQLIKAVTIPWSNILRMEKNGTAEQPVIWLQFKDNAAVVNLLGGIGKAFVKSNLEREGGLRISSLYSTGDFDALYERAKKHLQAVS